MEKNADTLTLILHRCADVLVTHEQVERVLAPVLCLISQGVFDNKRIRHSILREYVREFFYKVTGWSTWGWQHKEQKGFERAGGCTKQLSKKQSAAID